MIAIVGDDYFESGPIPLALALAGFETCEIKSPEDAAHRIDRNGPQVCVVVLDVRSVQSPEDAKGWGHLLDDPRVTAVVVASSDADPRARTLTQAPNRIVIEDPFDAAAVVAAALRASTAAPQRVHRVSSSTSPESRYAS